MNRRTPNDKDGEHMSGWISVKARLPEKSGQGAMYLVYDKEWDGVYVAEYFPKAYHQPDGRRLDWGWAPLDFPEITHWMPLPAPPVKAPRKISVACTCGRMFKVTIDREAHD